MTPAIECDYLVIGAGDIGVAFVDSLLSENRNLKVIFVDARHLPGGHWHDACPTALLHQPNDYYGCSYNRLESEKVVPSYGPRLVRASRNELLDYYTSVMHNLKKMYRVEYYPMSTYDEASGQIIPVLNRKNAWKVSVKRKVVNTDCVIRGPASGNISPLFDVADGVRVLPAYDLAKVTGPYSNYVVIGSGRAGMDAVLWLLSAGITPSLIQWIVPRDQWCFISDNAVPDTWMEMLIRFSQLVQDLEVSPHCLEDLLCELQNQGILCHVHDDNGALCNKGQGAHMAFHGTHVSKEELALLREVTNIVRMGHVRAVRPEGLDLDSGCLAQPTDTLYIDCASTWMRKAPSPVPIYEDRKIIVQNVQEACHAGGFWNACFHASYLGFLEGWRPTDTTWKNKYSTPMRPVDTFIGWLEAQAACVGLALVFKRPTATVDDMKINYWLANVPPGMYSAFPDEAKARYSEMLPLETFCAKVIPAIKSATNGTINNV